MVSNEDKKIGKILGSNSHIDYVCEIFRKGMVENPPNPLDFEFGQFVYIEKQINNQKKAFIGLIYDTQIIDPDQGRTGPKLSQPEEQQIFQPSYVDEKQLLAGILLLGQTSIVNKEVKNPSHSIPKWVLEVDDVVKKLSTNDMVKFHLINGEIRLGYYKRVLKVAGGFAGDILTQILSKLRERKPNEEEALKVIEKNLEWHKKMDGL